MKIAFHPMGGEAWTAGPIYLRNLLAALRQTYGEQLGLALLVLDEGARKATAADPLPVDAVICGDVPRRWSAQWAYYGLMRRLAMRRLEIERPLRMHEIDAVFGPVLTVTYPKTATLSWLPDFQHVHFPQMFAEGERVWRDRWFRQSAERATRIILMADTVRGEFESFAPQYAYKARTVSPVSHVAESVYEEDLERLLNIYHLPEKFVYLPGQFWKHKNHALAFRSVKMLKERGVRVVVVCSGSAGDYRHAAHFADVWRKVSEWNLRDQIIYVGVIPHEHVLGLIRQSVCVLNPSLCEGWGLTVDEARSVGKRVIVSDIPAHREQDPRKAAFFNPCDGEDLAGRLREVWEATAPGPDLALEAKARQELAKRRRATAESFVTVAQEAIDSARCSSPASRFPVGCRRTDAGAPGRAGEPVKGFRETR